MKKASWKASWAALTTGVLAAWQLPEHPPGLGVTIVAAGVAAGVLLAPHRRGIDFWVGASLSFLLVLPSMLLSAEWVVLPCLLLALITASVTSAGTTTTPGLFRSAAAGLRLVRGLGVIAAPVGERLPQVDRVWSEKILRTGAVVLILVAFFGGLFLTADAAFAHLVTDYLTPQVNVGLLPAQISTFLVAVGATGAIIAARGTSDSPIENVWARTSERRRPSPPEWIVPLVALNLLFTAFIAVQVTVLFGGHQRVLQTAGLTYAEYAREGFFQLLIVAFGTLAVVAGTVRWTGRLPQGLARQRTLLLGILCALTLVVLASALKRLGLYEEAFGYTRLRLVAHAALLWTGSVIAAVMTFGLMSRAGLLPRASLVITVATALGLAWINPDAYIARRNVDRFEATGKLDTHTLMQLGLDAVPELHRLPEPTRSCVLSVVAADTMPDGSLSAWNLSRSRAFDILAEAGPRAC